MKRLNNKGQSLVLFVLLLPIMISIMALVIDVGNTMTRKNDIDTTIETSIDNILKKDTITNYENEVESLEALLNYNLKKCTNKVSLNNNKILINTSTYVEGIFSKLLGFKGFKIESEYIAYIENSKIIKEKNK